MYTIDTVYSVYTIDTVYTVYITYVDTVYSIYAIYIDSVYTVFILHVLCPFPNLLYFLYPFPNLPNLPYHISSFPIPSIHITYPFFQVPLTLSFSSPASPFCSEHICLFLQAYVNCKFYNRMQFKEFKEV